MNYLLTHATGYAGPGVIEVLAKLENTIFCHDPSFKDSAKASEFESENPGCIALAAQTPEEIFNFVNGAKLSLDAVIHNDLLANNPAPIEFIPESDFVDSFRTLYLFPIKLTQLLLPMFRSKHNGSFVFVTSARYLKPEPGFSVATSIRSATTTFAQSLAVEVAQDNIQVNVVAPNYLYSETYYPAAKFINDKSGQDFIRGQVPLGRLGRPEEIGELIAFLTSGKSSFITGQLFNFTGGWPNYTARDLT